MIFQCVSPNTVTTELSIVIISFNTRLMTCASLRSVFKETQKYSFEVIVVDNASTDGSAEAIAREFPQVRLFACDENHGFAAANNMAVSQARGSWILLLNPDTLVLDGAIDRVLAFAKAHSEAAIFGGRTLFANGELNPTSCWGRPTLWSAFCLGVGLATIFKGSRLFDSEAIGGWARDSVREVDIVTGCFFLIRREDWDRLGGFDPMFFMYAEEADLCLRANKQGMKCLICPEAEIIHYGGASEKVFADKIIRLFRAKAQLFVQHWNPWAARFGVYTLDLWALSRMLLFGVIRFGRKYAAESYRAWCDIWQGRSEWHVKPASDGVSLERQNRVPKLCSETGGRSETCSPQ
jgi:GT2 family glycosyltransferase